MNKIINIAVIGLGQVGIYLLNELNTKKKEIELKTGKKIKVVAVSARNINKKRQFKVDKKLFYKNPLDILKKHQVDILFEAIGQSDGISKKIVEVALKNGTHVITPNKALELWKKIFHYGKAYDLVPYGTETMHLLRAEKGYVVIGQETDGTVTPIDLNFNWMIGKNKKDFIVA